MNNVNPAICRYLRQCNLCPRRRTTIYKYEEHLVGCPLQEPSKILGVALLQKGCVPFELTDGEFDGFLSLIESVCHGLNFLRRPWLAWTWQQRGLGTNNN